MRIISSDFSPPLQAFAQDLSGEGLTPPHPPLPPSLPPTQHFEMYIQATTERKKCRKLRIQVHKYCEL